MYGHLLTVYGHILYDLLCWDQLEAMHQLQMCRKNEQNFDFRKSFELIIAIDIILELPLPGMGNGSSDDEKCFLKSSPFRSSHDQKIFSVEMAVRFTSKH